MAQPQRRRRRKRRRSAGSRFGVLLLALLGVAGVLYMGIELATGPERTAQAQPTPTRMPAAPIATTLPTPSPEPTPALPAVDTGSWQLRLIRYEKPLGEDFVPESLVEIENGQQMDSRVAPAMKELIADARAAGYSVYVCSGYRDYNTQYIIYFNNHVDVYMAQGMTEEEANAKARLSVNYPGASEHQSGLCADILESADQEMEPYIGGSGLMLWLEEHCAEYGFVVRYPEGKTKITGVEYEPWHLRYVGKEPAAYKMERGLCLEEFLAMYDF